jgi:hypothetical protein
VVIQRGDDAGMQNVFGIAVRFVWIVTRSRRADYPELFQANT